MTEEGATKVFGGTVAMVCASNQNRSMQAHFTLVHEHGYNSVESYGTGNTVRLPGPSADRPNVYEFGTPYEEMLDDLLSKDEALYERLGLIDMLKRNIKVKRAPEKFQREREKQFDVIVTFETRVFDAVIEGV